MKKNIAIFLIACLVLSGCGGANTASNNSPSGTETGSDSGSGNENKVTLDNYQTNKDDSLKKEETDKEDENKNQVGTEDKTEKADSTATDKKEEGNGDTNPPATQPEAEKPAEAVPAPQEEPKTEPEVSDTSEAEESFFGDVVTFNVKDIEGKSYAHSMFYNNKLTLVNIMATWCPPCIAELPELGELYRDMKSKNVNFVCFVLDTMTMDGSGNVDEDAIDAALELQRQCNVDFPMLIPDKSFLQGLLYVESVPTTFFVDSKGNIVEGAVYVGANDYNKWKEVIEGILRELN